MCRSQPRRRCRCSRSASCRPRGHCICDVCVLMTKITRVVYSASGHVCHVNEDNYRSARTPPCWPREWMEPRQFDSMCASRVGSRRSCYFTVPRLMVRMVVTAWRHATMRPSQHRSALCARRLHEAHPRVFLGSIDIYASRRVRPCRSHPSPPMLAHMRLMRSSDEVHFSLTGRRPTGHGVARAGAHPMRTRPRGPAARSSAPAHGARCPQLAHAPRARRARVSRRR